MNVEGGAQDADMGDNGDQHDDDGEKQLVEIKDRVATTAVASIGLWSRDEP